MDSTDEEFYGSTTFITKGRRTKRQRTITTTATATATATATTSYHDSYFETSYGSSASANPSPSSTPEENDVVSELTTEEEETANCLILLSNGGLHRRRRRVGSVSAAAGVSGGVYECKTCNRTFPSFQALGGHRTSHKKIVKPPKIDEKINEIVNHVSSPVTPPQKIVTGGNRNSDTAAAEAAVVAVVRAHVCGICGSEFPSGQALGGHMRRHRPVVRAVTPEKHPMMIIQETSTSTSTGGAEMRNILPLDLNLPAPSDDHDQVVVVDSSQFHVLPTPALLDCHY